MDGRALAAAGRPASAAKDAEVDRIEHEQGRMLCVARAARELRRLRPEAVVSWTSDPPFSARTTYIPMIGADLATIRGLGYPPDPAVAPEQQGWAALAEGDFLLPWLLHITR